MTSDNISKTTGVFEQLSEELTKASLLLQQMNTRLTEMMSDKSQLTFSEFLEMDLLNTACICCSAELDKTTSFVKHQTEQLGDQLRQLHDSPIEMPADKMLYLVDTGSRLLH